MAATFASTAALVMMMMFMVCRNLNFVGFMSFDNMWNMFFNFNWDGTVYWDVHWIFLLFVHWIRNFLVYGIWDVVRHFDLNFHLLFLVNWDGVVNMNMDWVFHFFVDWIWDLLFVNNGVWFVYMNCNGSVNFDVNWVFLDLLDWIRFVNVDNFFDWVVNELYKILISFQSQTSSRTLTSPFQLGMVLAL